MAPRKSAKHNKRLERQSRARVAQLHKDGDQALARNDKLLAQTRGLIRRTRRLLHPVKGKL